MTGVNIGRGRDYATIEKPPFPVNWERRIRQLKTVVPDWETTASSPYGLPYDEKAAIMFEWLFIWLGLFPEIETTNANPDTPQGPRR